MSENQICKLISFNCKNIKRSVECVRSLCSTADIVALQETWLLPHDIPFLGTVDTNFGYVGTSAVDTASGVLRGRPHGGVALLWRKNVFKSVEILKCNNPRISAIKVKTSDRSAVFLSVYMPTDSAENLVIFTECLGEICAIVESAGAQSVYALGDYNAHPHELFGNELVDFCSEQDLLCADYEKLGMDSDTYTFISEAHGCKRWLDHCVTTESAWKSIVNITVHYDVYWSDHFPLEVTCNLSLLRSNSVKINVTCQNKIKWGQRSLDEISEYYRLCNNMLKEVDFIEEFSQCSDKHCNYIEHKVLIDNMYSRIVGILTKAAISSFKGKESNSNRRKIIGWNFHVKDLHQKARFKFKIWELAGKPKQGEKFDEMCESRKLFKAKIKWCQANQEKIKMDQIATSRNNKDFSKFWKQTEQLNIKPGLPDSIQGLNDPREICNMFKDHFKVSSSLGQSAGPPCGTVGADSCEGERFIRFSSQEIAKCIKCMKRGKSPGHDSLSIEHLLHGGPHLHRVLSMFYTLCLTHCHLPQAMLKTIVVPIIKK
ncbi:hypothetical protein JYU34_020793 [Plutella xylostella]|uniref:Endonuclease/exonuclease/phosphatase domain-containing protein n=1 Tax=Plutella xylostella TaxID=51655 RepID=A0ABQ7PS85_PLUXY|nr:hypothetical protein JYU34_020793 [Plutella xylostella]